MVATTWCSSQYFIRPAISQLKKINEAIHEWPVDAVPKDANKHYAIYKALPMKDFIISKYDSMTSFQLRKPNLYDSITTKLSPNNLFARSVRFNALNANYFRTNWDKPSNLSGLKELWNKKKHMASRYNLHKSALTVDTVRGVDGFKVGILYT